MLLALVHGTELATSFGKNNSIDVNLSIFLPNRALLPFIFSLKKHRYLHYSTHFTILLMEFLGDSSSLVRLYGYSTNWSGLPGLELAQNAAASPPPPLALSSQPTLTSRKDEAYQSWRNDTMITPRRCSHVNISTPPPEGNTFLPFVQGLLQAWNRRLLCAGLQLTTRHCFDANYSFNFRPNAGDKTACPCSFTDPQRVELPARRVEVTRSRIPSFDELQRQYENPSSLSSSSPSSPSSPPSHTSHITAHTIEHVLSSCPLTLQWRDTHLHHSRLPFIFGTKAGGIALSRFLHFSQLLQRPLPPRPDPP